MRMALQRLLTAVSQLLFCVTAVSVPRYPQQVEQVTLQMDGYAPTMDDDYVAVSLFIQPGYIVRFEPFADADRVHHMLLFGCEQPAFDIPLWKGLMTCRGSAHILYAWARNAPDLRLPEGVAFSVGHDDDTIRYLVLQMHYAHPFLGKTLDYSGVTMHMIEERPRNLAAVLLFVSGAPIPPGYSHYQTNVSCVYNGQTPLHPFAFRTHTHGMGRVVSAFFKNPVNGWTMIGKRNPQWPQLFQPITTNLTISNGDLMAATCVYDSLMQKKTMLMGSTGANEMCNFYMMFYWDANVPDPFPYGAGCAVEEQADVVRKEYPVEGVTLLPPHPEWEHKAHQSGKPFGITEGVVTSSVGGIELGQVSAVSFDSFGNLVIFHRGSRAWGVNSFDLDNNLVDRKTIPVDVLLVTQTNGINNTLRLIEKYGKNTFYMPHGLAIDHQNDYYTTDVGSHQVIKWTLSQGNLMKVFALGVEFTPGSDQNHFCKPAGIAVTVDGSIYVADGYCNNRIMKFDRNGKFLTQWGQPNFGPGRDLTLGSFAIPHDITANTDGSLLYISDRENARIQIYRNNGQPVGQIVSPQNSTAFLNIYSACYHNGEVYFVPGRTDDGIPHRAFSAHAEAARVQYSFEPTSYHFSQPHTIRVSPNGNYIYIGELGENGRGRVLQFIHHRDASAASEVRNAGYLSLHGARAEITKKSWLSTFLIVVIAVIVIPCFAIRLYRRANIIRKVKQQSVLDRAGFKPLRTDDSDTTDEDSDDEIISRTKKGSDRF